VVHSSNVRTCRAAGRSSNVPVYGAVGSLFEQTYRGGDLSHVSGRSLVEHTYVPCSRSSSNVRMYEAVGWLVEQTGMLVGVKSLSVRMYVPCSGLFIKHTCVRGRGAARRTNQSLVECTYVPAVGCLSNVCGTRPSIDLRRTASIRVSRHTAYDGGRLECLFSVLDGQYG
jgi:hypothetical protein